MTLRQDICFLRSLDKCLSRLSGIALPFQAAQQNLSRFQVLPASWRVIRPIMQEYVCGLRRIGDDVIPAAVPPRMNRNSRLPSTNNHSAAEPQARGLVPASIQNAGFLCGLDERLPSFLRIASAHHAEMTPFLSLKMLRGQHCLLGPAVEKEHRSTQRIIDKRKHGAPLSGAYSDGRSPRSNSHTRPNRPAWRQVPC